jgi:hypothetical protein
MSGGGAATAGTSIPISLVPGAGDSKSVAPPASLHEPGSRDGGGATARYVPPYVPVWPLSPSRPMRLDLVVEALRVFAVALASPRARDPHLMRRRRHCCLCPCPPSVVVTNNRSSAAARMSSSSAPQWRSILCPLSLQHPSPLTRATTPASFPTYVCYGSRQGI